MEGVMQIEPQAEHRWLERMVGDWVYESTGACGPGEEPFKARGFERVRSIGGLWVVGESEGEMPGGGSATMIITLGFDPARGRFTGTFIGSMMTHLWVYDGALDAAGTVLTLAAEGPSMAGDGTTARYEDVVTLVGPDERRLTARVQDEDGTWREMMTAVYRRKR
jgi:Protein of unknown function (DUF1579)